MSEQSSTSSSIMPRPVDVLPHREPFLLVSEVLALEPGQSIHARWHLSGDEYFWPGHFPGRPTLPGVLMVEALAQAGAIALLTDQRFTGKLPLFGGVDGVRFRKQAVPGDWLDLHVTMGKVNSRAGKGSGVAMVNGQKACEAEILFVLADL